MGISSIMLRCNESEISAINDGSQNAEELIMAERPDESPKVLDLDNLWQGLNWVLVESAMPTEDVLSAVVFGGTPVGDESSYGPPRLLDPAQVAALSTALAEVTPADVSDRYNAEAMTDADVYPDIWADPETDPTMRDELIDVLGQTQQFYQSAAEANDGILLMLT